MEMPASVFFNTRMPEAYDAVYTPAVGDPVTTVVLLDRDVEQFPGGFESNVSERRTEIEFRKDHVSSPSRDETVTVTLPAGDTVYTLHDVVTDDGFSVRISVRMSVTVPDGALIATTSGDYLVETTSGDFLIEI